MVLVYVLTFIVIGLLAYISRSYFNATPSGSSLTQKSNDKPEKVAETPVSQKEEPREEEKERDFNPIVYKVENNKTSLDLNTHKESGCCKTDESDSKCCSSKESKEKSTCCKSENSTDESDSKCCSSKQSKEKSTCCKSENSNNQKSGCGCSKSSLPKFAIIYGTASGTAETFAKQLYDDINKTGKFQPFMHDAEKYDPEDLGTTDYVTLIFATYTDGTPTATAKNFYWWLSDESLSERSYSMFRTVKYTVFGLGNSLYKENYNVVGRNLDKYLYKLGARRFFKKGEGDESNDQGKAFDQWRLELWKSLIRNKIIDDPSFINSVNSGRSQKKSIKLEIESEYGSDSEDEDGGEPIVDLEDLGSMMKKKKPSKNENEDDEDDDDDDYDADDDPTKPKEPTDMLSDYQKTVLTKQGYKVIGSHSGVKMCRWTKSMLRGRGGCYKHAFYGIQSHRCMEMTPSMACASKCVFCWRHHKNPVGTEWKWNTDPPEEILQQGMQKHIQMIKQMRGVPGVRPERYEEGFKIRHCALSLVGEPIIYPEINKFVQLLHGNGISSFLVTNAQWPEKIADLSPVTQMYISVDAATPESLKIIDRPLFKDYWERFIGCIENLRKRQQRTVFRLTLVKEYNMEEVKNYAELIRRGEPDFVEIKGVTFSGGKRPQIGMKHVPWHEEVIAFAKEIISESGDVYEIACEHARSCCLLLARVDKFKVDGKWNTWINFDKFLELEKSGKKDFSATEYMIETPSWALFGSTERGDLREDKITK